MTGATATRFRTIIGAAIVAGIGGIAGQTAQAQDCPTVITRIAPTMISGAYIRSVAVKTDAPVALPLIGAWTAALRRRTETSVVLRQLLFAPGDRADSARIAETLRRLRDQRLYADVSLGVARCTAGDTVDLTVTTVDAWTLRPIARIVPPATVSIGFEDRNILGTARMLSVASDQIREGHGASIAGTDPWMFGSDITGAFRLSDVAGAHLLRASIRNHEHSIFDQWRVTTAGGRQSFRATLAPTRPIISEFLVAEIGRRVDSSSAAATIAYAGFERDAGRILTFPNGSAGQPEDLRRNYVGVDLGIQRRTAQFDTASWFTGGRGFLDIPLGLQTDIAAGVGEDNSQHVPAMRYDGWIGHMWVPQRGQLVTADAWANGFVGPVRANHIARFSTSAYAEAPHGFWGSRLLFEQLIGLDPDLRVLSVAGIAADPSFSAVPSRFRSAGRALAANIERSVHIRPVARASMIDAGLFAAGSLRWASRESPSQQFAVAMAGGRVRVFSANGSITSTRIDFGYPIASNRKTVRHWLFSVSLNTLLDAPRQRDGRRRQQ